MDNDLRKVPSKNVPTFELVQVLTVVLHTKSMNYNVPTSTLVMGKSDSNWILKLRTIVYLMTYEQNVTSAQAHEMLNTV